MDLQYLRIKDVNGTPIDWLTLTGRKIADIQGLSGVAAARLKLRGQTARHGAIIESPTYTEHKVIVIQGEVTGETWADTKA